VSVINRKEYVIFNEIKSQGEKWVSIFEKYQKEETSLLQNLKEYSEIYFLGSGSSYNNALMAEFANNKLSEKRSYAINSSEYLFNPDVFIKSGDKNNKVFVISRTGETTDTMLAMEILKKSGFSLIALTTFPESSISKNSDALINFYDCKEQSITSNRVVSSITLFLLCLFLRLSGRESTLKKIKDYSISFFTGFEDYCKGISRIINTSDFNKFIFLGTGPFHSVAREASLKTREMSITDTEFWPTLEYRQGYMTNADEKDLAIVFLSATNIDFQFKTCMELKRAGSKVLIINDRAGLGDFKKLYDYEFNVDLGVEDELICQVYYQLFGQLIGYYQALKKNIDPSNPKNLDYIVRT
jgi:glucosamine--fructose-6-phosphate aminotransferase (isomerizing)